MSSRCRFVSPLAFVAPALVLVFLTALRAAAAPVLMISIDGLKPEYVTQADAHGLKVPYLRSLLTEGTYAEGVIGVWPTVTYPSHTTLVTGATPAQHGIYDNLEFDPQHHFGDAWFWYADQIKTPTLWQVAHRAGIRTASIGWPVTVGATDIDLLVPEYWRVFRPAAQTDPSDHYLIAALSRPEGLLSELERSTGSFLGDTSLAADEVKTRFVIELLETRRPGFTTLHLSSLDSAEHEHGPFSSAANADLEALDGMVRRLADAAAAADPAAIVCVVSDHGFVALTARINLGIPFVQAGLIDRATPWGAGGMAAIMLKDPQNAEVLRQVHELLVHMAADPRLGIAAILDPAEIAKRGGFPGAAFLVVMKPGFYVGGDLEGEVVIPMADHGGHGFAPTYPEMRSAFFIAGRGIAPHRNLKIIDMRQIAPTVAELLGAPLTSAAEPPLPVRR